MELYELVYNQNEKKNISFVRMFQQIGKVNKKGKN